jgi:ABC-type multidrug transport system fused ATPase/permease subunit
MATSALDLIGVLLFGIVAALSVSVVGGGSPPAAVTEWLGRLGISSEDPVAVAIPLACVAAFLLILKSGVNVILTRRILRFLANRQAIVSGLLAEALLARPLLQLQRRSSQETAYALTSGVNAATLIVLGQGVVAVSEATLLLVLAVGLLLISPIVTVFTIAFFVVIAVILQKLLSGWAGRLGLRAYNTEVASLEAIQEALRTYREVVVSNRRTYYVHRFQGLRWQSAEVQSDLQFMGLVPKFVFEIALVVGAGLLAASQFLTKDAEAALGVIAVFLAAGSRILPSIMRLQGAAVSVKSAAGLAAPTFELAGELYGWNTQDDGGPVDEGGDKNAASSAQSRIRDGHPGFVPDLLLEDVYVRYPGCEGFALNNVSLSLSAGASLALVGPTGAGKSTLADVILGVILPQEGSVLIGGVSPIEAVGRWPGGLAYVPQDVAMTNGSARQNVALGLPGDEIDDDLVWEALERAHLAGFLRDHRDGLETVIGESGVRLSGGQRQRLGVARALYTRPRLLVLDEATSALDAETERAITETLRDLKGSVTTVTVAHRLATIRHCDVVAYLEDGEIRAVGSFTEVREQSPQFNKQAILLGL